jgi:hypothetical protein
MSTVFLPNDHRFHKNCLCFDVVLDVPRKMLKANLLHIKQIVIS